MLSKEDARVAAAINSKDTERTFKAAADRSETIAEGDDEEK